MILCVEELDIPRSCYKHPCRAVNTMRYDVSTQEDEASWRGATHGNVGSDAEQFQNVGNTCKTMLQLWKGMRTLAKTIQMYATPCQSIRNALAYNHANTFKHTKPCQHAGNTCRTMPKPWQCMQKQVCGNNSKCMQPHTKAMGMHVKPYWNHDNACKPLPKHCNCMQGHAKTMERV